MSRPLKCRTLAIVAGLTLAGMSFAPIGYTAGRNAAFRLSATVPPSCLIRFGNMEFGTYEPKGGDLRSWADVMVDCSDGARFLLGLNAGIGRGASILERRMTNGAHTLAYNLYLDAMLTVPWGDSMSGRWVIWDDFGMGAPVHLLMYGLIPGGQNVSPGSYSDTITATIEF